MKFNGMRLALLVAVALFAFGCNAKNVATVNTELVYQKSAASEKGASYLKALDTELTAELNALQQKMQSATNKKAAQAELQKALMEIQQRFGAEQQQVLTALSSNYKAALENMRAKYRLDAVFASDMVLTADPAIDMTEKAIEEMNAIPVDFKPLTAESAAKPAQ